MTSKEAYTQGRDEAPKSDEAACKGMEEAMQKTAQASERKKSSSKRRRHTEELEADARINRPAGRARPDIEGAAPGHGRTPKMVIFAPHSPILRLDFTFRCPDGRVEFTINNY